jgi:hypothetical protein
MNSDHDGKHSQSPGNRREPLTPVGNPKYKILGIGEHWQASINSFTYWYWYRPHGTPNKANLKLCYYQCCCVEESKTSCNPWVRTCCTNLCFHNETCGLIMSCPLFCGCICISAFLCGGDDESRPHNGLNAVGAVHGPRGIFEFCCEILPLDCVRAACHAPCLYSSRYFYNFCCCPSNQVATGTAIQLE